MQSLISTFKLIDLGGVRSDTGFLHDNHRKISHRDWIILFGQ